MRLDDMDVSGVDVEDQRGGSGRRRGRLPFPSVLVGSRNDPYCGWERARGFAADWGAVFVDLGHAGHINAESGLGDWPQGHAFLIDLMSKKD